MNQHAAGLCKSQLLLSVSNVIIMSLYVPLYPLIFFLPFTHTLSPINSTMIIHLLTCLSCLISLKIIFIFLSSLYFSTMCQSSSVSVVIPFFYAE